MEEVKRPDQPRIGLEELPEKSLRPVPGHEHVEAPPQGPWRANRQAGKIGGQEQGHRQALVDLHGVAADVVAQVHRPGQARRRAIGEIRQSGEQAAKAADDNPGGQGPDEHPARGAPHAAQGLVDLNQDNGPGQGASDAVRQGRRRTPQGVERAGQPGAEHRANAQGDEIGRPGLARHLGHRRLQPPTIEAPPHRGAARPGGHVEYRVPGGICRDDDHAARVAGPAGDGKALLVPARLPRRRRWAYRGQPAFPRGRRGPSALGDGHVHHHRQF